MLRLRKIIEADYGQVAARPQTEFLHAQHYAERRRIVTRDDGSHLGVLLNDGLAPGEWIVVKGVHSVREGQKVRILDVTKEEKTP